MRRRVSSGSRRTSSIILSAGESANLPLLCDVMPHGRPPMMQQAWQRLLRQLAFFGRLHTQSPGSFVVAAAAAAGTT